MSKIHISSYSLLQKATHVACYKRNQFSSKKVLVTGGAGFIGSWLSEALVRQGALVKVLDNFQSGTIENLRNIRSSIELIRGDIRNYETIKHAVDGAAFVFHLAANASVPASIEDPTYDFDANALGTFNVLKAIYESDNDPVVIFASSAAVYGEPDYTPIDEAHPLNPVSFYGASKMACEAYCKAFYHIHGIKTVILRLFNVYGPRQPRYVMYELLQKINSNSTNLQVLGTGEQKRDFTHVADCVKAFFLAAGEPNAIGRAINIGTGGRTTIKQLTDLIIELLGLTGRLKVTYTGKSWKGDVERLVADVTLSQRLLGYRPEIPLRLGLRNFIDWTLKR